MDETVSQSLHEHDDARKRNVPEQSNSGLLVQPVRLMSVCVDVARCVTRANDDAGHSVSMLSCTLSCHLHSGSTVSSLRTRLLSLSPTISLDYFISVQCIL